MMSMNMKELQWRIRNYYELRVGIFAKKKVERDEDAVSDKKLMSEIFILHKFLCCLDLKRSCPSCFFGRNVATNIYLKESHHHSVKYNI